jgi:hypothetical protein
MALNIEIETGSRERAVRLSQLDPEGSRHAEGANRQTSSRLQAVGA